MCEYTIAPERSVKRLPDNIPLEIGALVEPLAVGWHAVDISPYKVGDSVLVLGGGPIGLAVVQALVGKKCQNIIVSEISSKRRQFADDFGAHHVIDPTACDMVEEVERLTAGEGADLCFDAAGVQPALDAAFKAIKARGTVVNIAVWPKRATLDMNDVVFRERAYMGVATYAPGDFEAVIKALSAGSMDPKGMITKVIAMDEVVEEGFKALIEDKDSQVKILVDVGQGVSGLSKVDSGVDLQAS